MKLDTEAAVSTISKSEFDIQLRLLVNLEPITLELRTYTGETVRPIGVCKVRVEYQDQVRLHPTLRVTGKRTGSIWT